MAAHVDLKYQIARVGESAELPYDFLVWPSEEHVWGNSIELRSPDGVSGTVFPEGPTILDVGHYYNGSYDLEGWWIEGPEGATGAGVTAEPVDNVESPVSGDEVERIRIYFIAGDLAGRYPFRDGFNADEKMIIDVVE